MSDATRNAAVKAMLNEEHAKHAPTPKVLEVQARHKDSKPVERKDGPIWCKMGKRKVTRDAQAHAGVTYKGAKIVCPDCGAETQMLLGDVYPDNYSYKSHPRADMYVEAGKIVKVSRETSADKPVEDANPRF